MMTEWRSTLTNIPGVQLGELGASGAQFIGALPPLPYACVRGGPMTMSSQAAQCRGIRAEWLVILDTRS